MPITSPKIHIYLINLIKNKNLIPLIIFFLLFSDDNSFQQASQSSKI